MSDHVETLKTLLGEVADLRHAADLIEWDERVCMPPGGASVHGQMLSTLRRLAHEKFASDAMGKAIHDARHFLEGGDEDGDSSRLVAVTTRDYEKARNVPADFVAEHARVVSAAQHAWIQARAASDFSSFQSFLQKVVDLKKQYVTFFPAADHPYDVLLDDFEPGMKTADVQAIFDQLRERQVALIRAVGERPQVAADFLHVPYPEADMWDFAVQVITAFGFDWTRGRQDKSVHPFASAVGADDVRITTRFVEGQAFSLLFGTMHEAGHALYEQGVSTRHHRTSLEGGASLGVHESQSRLWENVIGRSLAFWRHFFPMLQARFPSQLDTITLETFYKGINRVAPSLIRVEADEATYNLHVMLRVELEIALIQGDLAVGDLPAAWNARMRGDLGVEPPDDGHGVLQDIHWAAGLLGYFATYTLGNVIAAQLWKTFEAAHPTCDDEIRSGEFTSLLSWLRVELHQHGRKYPPADLVKRFTGSPIDPAAYLRYLETKYSEVYGL